MRNVYTKIYSPLPLKYDRQPYAGKDGKSKLAGYYKVDAIGIPQEFRLGIRNEKLAAKEDIKSYEDLVGKTLILRVKAFQLGRGFVGFGLSKRYFSSSA